MANYSISGNDIFTLTTISLSDLTEHILSTAPGLIHRPGQVEMARLVASALSGEKEEPHVAVEAGTGTGKSFAYLIPAMLVSVLEGKRVVVATAKKNLQRQLIEKDAPFASFLVQKETGKTPTFAFLAGKQNYLCPELLERRICKLLEKQEGRLFSVPDSEEEELIFLAHIAEWFWASGGSGLLDDLPAFSSTSVSPEEKDCWWSRVSAADDDADCKNCVSPNSYACPFLAARERAAQADVVIANHHLVAMDWLLREKAGFSFFAVKNFSPPEILIVDEAHDFLTAVRSTLEACFTQQRWLRLKADVWNFISSDLLKEIRSILNNDGNKQRKVEFFNEKRKEDEKKLLKLAERADKKVNDLFSEMKVLLEKEKNRSHLLLLPGATPEKGKETYEALEHYCTEAVKQIEQLLGLLQLYVAPSKNLLRKAERLKERSAEVLETVSRSVLLKRHYRYAGETGDACSFDGRRFTATPVKPAPALASLWAQYQHVVHTSATLFPFPQSTGFAWYKDEYGFQEGEIVMGVVASPFRYEEQMQAYVLLDSDLEPNGKGKNDKSNFEKRAEKLAEMVLRLAGRVSGGVMVLFTSFYEMNAVTKKLEGRLSPDRILLVQGRDGGKAEMLERFKRHGKGVLLGVDSFWEGVDVPGDALSALVIVKLPFPVPDDPLTEALCWLAGKDWWVKVYRPATAIKLRQGVGRLIRREDDQGIVVIADPRMADKHRFFYQCLPVKPKEVEALESR